MKKFLHELWTTPYPEFIVGKIGRLFEHITPRRHLSRQMYLFLSAFICLISVAAMLVLGGTLNPIDLFFEIPVFSFHSFLDGIPNEMPTTWPMFCAFSAVITFAVLYLLRSFVFRKQDYPRFTLNWFVYAAMNFFLAIVLNMVCMKVFTYIHINYITDTYADPVTLGLALFANFGIYFVLKDAFESQLSFTLTPVICNLLGMKMFSLGLFHYLAISIVIKAIVWIVEKTGIWDVVIRFIAKWLYTLKYICRIVFCFYFFVIAVCFFIPKLFVAAENKSDGNGR